MGEPFWAAPSSTARRIALAWLWSSSLTVRRGAAQRTAPCFDEDLLRHCHEQDPLGVAPLNTEVTCHSIIVDYFDRQEDLVQDPDERVARLGALPANSDLCTNLAPVFPYCYWCVREVPCFHPPDFIFSCEQTTPQVDDTDIGSTTSAFSAAEIHDYCTDLEEWLVGIEWGTYDQHYQRLVVEDDRYGSVEECDGLRQAYAQCYWCKPDLRNTTTLTDSPVPNDYCSTDMLCRGNTTTTTQDSLVALSLDQVQIEETCAEMDALAARPYLNTWPLTWDLCDRAAIAIPAGCAERHCEPCFHTTDSSCSAPVNGSGALLDDAVVLDLCQNLWWYVRDDPWNLTHHEKALAAIRVSSPQCQNFHDVYHRCFWCNPQNASYDCVGNPVCTFDEPLSLDDTEADPGFQDEFQDGAACDDLRNVVKLDMFPSTAQLCAKAETFAPYCSCDNPELTPAFDYIGADTLARKRALVWVSRAAAFLSLVGGSYILWDSLSHAEKRGTVYHQLLVGMATFDFLTAMAWAFATAPIPQDDVEGGGYNIVGSRGNDETCEAQAFFVQLGVTSIFYNVSLAVYYVLVIVYGRREHFLRRIRLYLHVVPVLVGFGLAFGGLTRYGWFEYGCHIQPSPEGEMRDALLFVVVPIGLSIVCITFAMLAVYLSVRSKSRASRRWSSGSSGTLERYVFWQALFYTLSFYMTWPVVFCVYVGGLDARSSRYGFSVLVAFVAPLQGFNNFLVYVRPKSYQRLGEAQKRDACSICVCLYPNHPTIVSGDEQPRKDIGFDEPVGVAEVSRQPRNTDPSVAIAMEEEPLPAGAIVAEEGADEDPASTNEVQGGCYDTQTTDEASRGLASVTLGSPS